MLNTVSKVSLRAIIVKVLVKHTTHTHTHSVETETL